MSALSSSQVRVISSPARIVPPSGKTVTLGDVSTTSPGSSSSSGSGSSCTSMRRYSVKMLT